jgi:hypothetical protein
MLAGWLFADLFLLLLITGLAVLPAKPKTARSSPALTTSSPHPSTSPGTPTVSPSPSATATHRRGLNAPVVLTVKLSAENYQANKDLFLAEVKDAMKAADPRDATVGFAEVEAYEPTPDQAGFATDTAKDALSLLQRKSPLFAVAQGIGGWDGASTVNGKQYGFMIRIFLLN